MTAIWTPATHQHQAERERLAFTSLSIDRAPGIHPGFTIDDLSPDINIVFGPNASGKSTTARAIQALIWPHPSTLRGHHLRAEFDLGDEHWEIEADAARVTRSRDGEPAVAPVVAPIDDRVRYTLGLHDLLASENQPMAQAILKESSGGFDLDAVATDLAYTGTIPPRLESARNVESALVRLRDAERAQGEVAAQARQLTTLREQERMARQGEADADAIRKALHLAHVRHDLDQARRYLAVFPEGLAHTRGDEPDRVAAINERLSELDAKRAELERSRDQALAERNAVGLGDQPSNEGIVQSLREVRDSLRQIDTDLAALQRDLKSARAERESNQRRLALEISDAQIAALDADGIRELAGLAHAYEDIRVRRRARDEVEQWIGNVSRPENIDTLRSGIEALSKRIQNPNREETGALIGKARTAAYIGGLLVIASAIWLANFAAWPWILLAVLGAVIIYFAWRYTMPASVQEAAVWEDRYRELGLPEPTSWTIPAVRDRMNDLQEELRVALVDQEKADRWASLEQERIDLDRAYSETEARRAKAVAQYGVAPDLGEESLRLLADNLGRWQAADTAVRAIEARLNQAGSERLRREAQLRKTLEPYGYDTPQWDEHIEDLDHRFRVLREANERAESRSRELEGSLRPEIERNKSARAAIFRQVGLDDDQDDALRAQVNQLETYRAARQRVADSDQAVREASNALALTPHLRDMDASELNRQLEEADSAAARLDPIMREIGEIRTRIGDAKRRHDIEQALGRRDDAMNALRQDRDDLYGAIVGQKLLGSIQEETRDAAMPIVFHRARELFSIITRGRYELEFEEGPPPSFLARDTSTGMVLQLDQLSSGTRVQVLMAIRLAFVENVEAGPKLPVLLDETLGNSDEFRAGAIIDAAIEIARKGRQVFYFTAQGDEVARWQARLSQLSSSERPAVTVVDLADIRRDAGFDRLPMGAPQEVIDTRLVAPPNGLDRETYGAVIKAPRIDPWMDGSGGIHLWHLVDDLPALHTLLEQDIQVWGQLAGLVRASGIEGLTRLGIEAELWDRAESRMHLLETASALWRIGRARRVSPRDIADSGVVDPAAMDAISKSLADNDGDAAALVESLRDDEESPLPEQTTDRLEAWLISEGFIAQGAPLSPDDLRERATRASREDLRRGRLADADIADALRQLPG